MSPQSAVEPTKGLEKQLLHILRFSGIEKDNLQELVGIVVGLQSKGLSRLRVFPRGLPPVVDGLNVSATVDTANLAGILNVILTQTPRLGGVSVFPYGITNPEAFQVNVSLGNTVDAGVAVETGTGG
jgi:hypothetical protein